MKEESKQVQRAREKLKKKLEVEHHKFTTDALQEMSRKIRTLIFRKHSESESPLKGRKVTLVDQEHILTESKNKKVQRIQNMLKSG